MSEQTSAQDEREVLLDLLTHLPAGVTEEGQEVPLLHMLPESAREYLRDAILTEGFHLTPTTGLKAEALREAAEKAWDEGFTRGFYSGQWMGPDADAFESPHKNPYAAERLRAEREDAKRDCELRFEERESNE